MKDVLFLLLCVVSLSLGFPQVDGQAQSELPFTCDDPSYDCVPFFQCRDGVIITDGGGLIDERTKPPASCVNKEFPEVTAVCCLIPGSTPTKQPVGLDCPRNGECVDPILCGTDGTIKTDGSGIIDPRSNSIKCVQADKSEGVCCLPPKDEIPFTKCPQNFECVPTGTCAGKAIDIKGTPLDYTTQGIWTTCEIEKGGVCCQQSDGGQVVQEKCGNRNYELDKRIQADSPKNEAGFGEFPWQTIIFNQSFFFKCGASLITKKHVITAAHCIHGEQPTNLRLRFGEWKVNSFDEKFPYVDRNALSVTIHPQYDHKSKNFYNDLAIIELDKPVDIQYHVNTICLPKEGLTNIAPGTLCYASGWGKDAFHGKFQHVLKKIDLPYIDHKTCQTLMRETRLGKHFRLHNSFICAGGQENKDACYGDGGGPLVCKNPGGFYDLVGITAWGIGCGTKDVPGVYVNVKHFSSWIDKVLGSYKQI